MADSNQLRVTSVKETTFGTTPTTPRMRTRRITSHGLRYAPVFITSNEIRADRMLPDPIKVNETNEGPLGIEMSYPVENSPLATDFESALYSSWVNTPSRDNDGTADSVITDVNATGGVVTVTTGAAFAVGHLVRATGFTNAANNGLFRCTTGSATVPAFASQSLVSESAPPAAARMKVVGLQGASGDITATASGLGSTSLDFTTLGLAAGMWVKIGDASDAAYSFGTAALNGWARVTAVAANAVTLDNLPAGWTTDSGTSKTIRVFFGDYLKNGTTRVSQTIETAYSDQATPTYVAQRGLVVNTMELNATAEQILTGSFGYMGLSGAQGTVTLDASPDAATTSAILSSSVSVGRIAVGGSAIASPNWARSLTIQTTNNLRMLTAVGTVGAVDIGAGEFGVTGTIETYFGSNALLSTLFAGTATSINARATAGNQAVVFEIPRATFTDGSANAGGKNQDVLLPLQYAASIDPTTSAHLIVNRLEYFAS